LPDQIPDPIDRDEAQLDIEREVAQTPRVNVVFLDHDATGETGWAASTPMY
jgi:hypothetical protein